MCGSAAFARSNAAAFGATSGACPGAGTDGDWRPDICVSLRSSSPRASRGVRVEGAFRMSVDLSGAADLHCHFGPDAHRERSVDAFEAAREAAAAGHRAVVLKSHDFPTVSLAWSVQRDVGGAISVFGGICCDREVGGMNPAAVEVALDLGARIVWLPTLSSRQDFENGVAAQLGIPGPGIVVTDESGELLPETKEVLALVREHDAV